MCFLCGYGKKRGDIFYIGKNFVTLHDKTDYMRNSFYYILFLMLLVAVATAEAQNNTSSPYSRFGYGELNDNVPGAYRAMGGVGTGMRRATVINPSQPASYSVVDSTSFMFDLGVSAMWSNYRDASGARNLANGNLEYLTIQLPIWKYIGLSVGVLPYSMVGYDFALSDSINNDYHYTKSYSGKGGITQIYGGLSFNIMDWVAVGANVYYMFGETSNTRSVSFSESELGSVIQNSTFRVSDVRFRYGMQLFHTFGDHTVVLGGTFEAQSKLNSKYKQIETNTLDTVQNLSGGCDLPMTYSAGFSYSWANRLLVAADYTNTEWSRARYFGQQNALRDRMKISVGAEYRHNPMGKKYVERMPFRLGCSVSDSYLKNVNAKDFSVSLGVGFPLRNVATVINTTLEYGHRGSMQMLSENYLKLTINASITEYWFFKRKL